MKTNSNKMSEMQIFTLHPPSDDEEDDRKRAKGNMRLKEKFKGTVEKMERLIES